MKSMTCQQLGGACEEVFQAATFDEMAELSQQHGMKMFQDQEPAHLKAMEAMQALMKSPDAMEQWFDSKRAQFDSLPED